MKKKEQINLRTDLKDIDNISNCVLRQWTCQNFTEIINKPKKDTKFRRDSKRSTFSCDANLDKFINYDFQLSESSRYNNQMMENIPNLIDQNYTKYIHSIKKIYPNFRFNHYSHYSAKAKLNSSMMSSNTDLRTYNTFDSHISFANDDYIPSTKLSNIRLGKEYLVCKEEFKLKEDIFEQNRLQLNNKSREFDYKVEAIEMELEKILSNSNLLYNYIERNISIGKEIDSSIYSLKSKNGIKEILNRKYIVNSSLIILKGLKRQNIKKSKTQLSKLIELHSIINSLSSLNKEEIANNDISDGLSEAKALIKIIDKTKRLKCVFQCEKEIQVLENRSEHKLSGDLLLILKKLLMHSIQCDDTINSKLTNGTMKKKMEFIYKTDFQSNYSDYSFGKEMKKTIILISKDEGCKIFLYQLLDCINIIIKDNFDIEDFIALIEKGFREIILKLFDVIQKEYCSEQNKLIEVLVQAFIMFYLNYEYVIYLFELNFGWVKKIFLMLERQIVEEMNKLISCIISSITHEIIISGELERYLISKTQLSTICNDYYQLVKADYSLIFKQFDLEFVIIYFEKQTNWLISCFEKEQWTQVHEVNNSYIEMAKILMSDLNQMSINSFISNSIPNNNVNDNDNGNKIKHEFILLKENKFKPIKLSLEEISFIYSCLYLVCSFNKSMIPEIAKSAFKVLKLISNKAKTLLTDENEERPITDKEIALLSSNIQVIKQIVNSFAISTDTLKIDELDALVNTLNDISLECKNGMIQLLNEVNTGMIEDLTNLDFANYPFFEKDYNTYIKKFTKIKKLYDGMLYGFDSKDIIDIFNNQLEFTFIDIDKVITSKCRIEVDKSLKQ